ncbi:pentatricopeptide repeat-containing protein At1g05750, chloroplastic [Dendrobium catenatum]|uniref:Pentatricopeptide repeat-containing protein n=1 Tax=Dendrobium catenatum TaxID=906689 RepID=A0A2I0VGG4_9ASPA|nr:pentatricopeptide repeat-containing protein At1g05750, chloroplastic [Dendrobium catenatum]PKU62510.1 Pentatricopeptide repeat-containing protein [Dendrobium catenatum]
MSCSAPPSLLLSSPHLLLPVAPPLTVSPSRSCDPRSGDVVSWTSSIGRLARHGHLAAAAAEFSAMLSSSTSPNHVTFITLLSACADFSSSPFSFQLGLSLHSLALKLSLFSSPRSLLLLTTALIDFYFKIGFTVVARQLFDRTPLRNRYTYNAMIAGHMKNAQINEALDIFLRIPSRDLVSWTAIIDGCVKNGFPEEALEHFRKMQVERIDPDYVTVIAVAAACSDLGALGHGMWLHYLALKRGLLGNVRVGNSLIDMYSKCGRIDFAQQVFDKMPKRTLVSWNSMIMGLAVNGRSAEALLLFSAMQGSEFKPDSVSFTAALTSCSHAGLVDDGLYLFQLMQRKYGVTARAEHYGCLVDLLARAGLIEKAVSLVERMPMKPNEVMLGSLMAACCAHGDVRVAERLMALLIQVEPDTDSNYVLLSNIYAAMGRWEGVVKVRSLMKELGVKKKPGFSAVEIDSIVHQFVAGDHAHAETEEIYDLLDLLHFDLEFYGYEHTIAAGAIAEAFSEGFID